MSEKSKTLKVIISVFESNYGAEGGGLKIKNCFNALLLSTTFLNNSALSGGGIFSDNPSLPFFY